MRLTHKTNDNFDRYLPNHKNTREQINNKLGKLEDIEDELGMSLLKFIECLHLIDKDEFKPVYYDEDKELVFTSITPIQVFVDTINNEFVELRRYKGYEAHWKFKDYGKTWALTKEELTK